MKRHGIAVTNVSGGSNNTVAEYAVTCASLPLRRFSWADAEIRQGRYAPFRARMIEDNLRGLEGYWSGSSDWGRSAVRSRVRSGRRERRSAITRCDVVSVQVPLLPETHSMIGAAELAFMRPGAALIQASRGGIVDEAALADCLSSGHLGAAAVDVYASEPPRSNNPLLALQGDAGHRLLLTPHIAGVMRRAWASLFRAAWENVERALVYGQTPLNRIA
jgi:glycerate dehydrogenase